MVKIPGFDELKKMGSSLIDSAKSVNIGETVDKLKTLGGKKTAAAPAEQNTPAGMAAAISASLDELIAVQALQASAIKKIQEQLAELNKMIETGQKPTV